MKALLVRVGIDSTYGKWNAPVNPKTREFAYVPIPEQHPRKAVRPGYERSYREFKAACESLGAEFPERLLNKFAHVDPDFEYLTYGDANQKGEQIRKLVEGDMLAFYAGLRLPESHSGKLLYAFIGFYVVDRVVAAPDVPKEDWHKNAHTRRLFDQTDWIVLGKPGFSGRLERCIPIGEWRDRAYRVSRNLLDVWGSLSARNGYIQRSAILPQVGDLTKFYEWFKRQNVSLRVRNN